MTYEEKAQLVCKGLREYPQKVYLLPTYAGKDIGYLLPYIEKEYPNVVTLRSYFGVFILINKQQLEKLIAFLTKQSKVWGYEPTCQKELKMIEHKLQNEERWQNL